MSANYKIIYSKRKTLCIQVKRNRTVCVRAPFGTPTHVIERFVSEHADWIKKSLERMYEKTNVIDLLSDVDVSELRRKAKTVIPPKAEYYAQLMGVKYTGIKITSAKTRFGSCSAKNSLCFSLYLMLYDERAIDYVVVHELAHIKEKNHSARFYKVVESVMPDYKTRAKLLKK